MECLCSMQTYCIFQYGEIRELCGYVKECPHKLKGNQETETKNLEPSHIDTPHKHG